MAASRRGPWPLGSAPGAPDDEVVSPGPRARASLTFLGAAGTVTGSRFHLQTDRSQLLVDAGLFQGLRALRRRNWDPFPVEARELDAVVVSHAHLDHSGYLPVLGREGLRAPVLATASTIALTELVLRDSAKLQEEDAAFAAAGGYSKHAHPRPLYDAADVERLLPLLHAVPFHEQIEVTDDIAVRLRPAGHILGSSTVLVEVGEGRVLFSGDLGRQQHPLLAPPAPPSQAETVVVESTYGDRRHETSGDEMLAAAITRTAARGGVILIPAFAVDRTEVVLMALRRLTVLGAIPALPVYADSPMALAALEIYRDALRRGSPDLRPEHRTEDIFDPGDLHEARTAQESMELNSPGHPCIIVSASGMATGGRVVHHLRHLLPDARNTVVLVGYQALGTRGRDLAEGAPQLKMHGQYVPVRAEVVDVGGFSVHADADEVLAWLGQLAEPPDTTYVVHGEPKASAVLADRIRDELGWLAVVPRHGERVRVR
jgi:metallo-beta-lactamase family protein